MGAKTKTVLLVDDEVDIRVTISKLLESRGFHVLAVGSGREALEALRCDKGIALVILDIMMPEMDGYEAYAGMQKEGLDVPVIMLTAKSTNKDIMKGYGIGVDYYITKPFRNDVLLNIVNYFIGDISAEERQKLEAML